MNYNAPNDLFFLETADQRPPQQRSHQGQAAQGNHGPLKLQVAAPKTSNKKETPKEPEGGKKFRITYRSEVYITAANEEEAREKFEALDLTSKEGNSRFVEEVSFEPQD